MKLLVLYVIMNMSQNSFSQKQVSYTVKPGAQISDVIPRNEIYRYPVFTDGTVAFKDGKTVVGKLNHNMLFGSIQFLDPKGDTLALINENTIKLVSILTDTFYFDRGYYHVTSSNGPVKLLEKKYFKEFVQKPGSYGLTSSTTSVDNISSILERRSYELNTSQELILVKHAEFALATDDGYVIYPDKKKLLKIYSKHKQTVETYMNKNPVAANSKDDLLNLMNFLADLEK